MQAIVFIFSSENVIFQWYTLLLSTNSRSKANFSFQFMASYVYYSMEKLAADLLFGLLSEVSITFHLVICATLCPWVMKYLLASLSLSLSLSLSRSLALRLPLSLSPFSLLTASRFAYRRRLRFPYVDREASAEAPTWLSFKNMTA